MEAQQSLILASLIAIPWLYFLPPRGNLRSGLSTVILVHTIITLRTAVLTPPPNLFMQLHVPLGTPTDALRNLLRGAAERSKYVDQLLTRMGSFETRTLYVRFGHYVLSTCDYCHSYNDFALYALPGFMWSYLKELALIGLITMSGSGKEALRKYAVAFLVLGALVEAYWLATVGIGIPKDPYAPTLMWHDELYRGRHLIFVLLPIAIHFFPVTSSSSGTKLSPAAQRQLHSLQSLGAKLQLLELSRGAIQRNPELASSADAYWTRNAKESSAVREDERVQDAAQRMGMGYEEFQVADPSTEDVSDPSRLRKKAREVTRGLLSTVGLGPSVQRK